MESRSFHTPATQYYTEIHSGVKASISHATCTKRCGWAMSTVFRPAVDLFAYLFSPTMQQNRLLWHPSVFSLSTSIEGTTDNPGMETKCPQLWSSPAPSFWVVPLTSLLGKLTVPCLVLGGSAAGTEGLLVQDRSSSAPCELTF